MPANAILPDKGEKALLKEGAAIDFVRAAFSHLKAIPDDQCGQMLLKKSECLTGRRRLGCQRQDRIHHCSQDAPMGSGKRPFWQFSSNSITLKKEDRTWISMQGSVP
jgi:hypothetical protein